MHSLVNAPRPESGRPGLRQAAGGRGMGLRPALSTQSCRRASVPSLLPFVAGRQILAAADRATAALMTTRSLPEQFRALPRSRK